MTGDITCLAVNLSSVLLMIAIMCMYSIQGENSSHQCCRETQRSERQGHFKQYSKDFDGTDISAVQYRYVLRTKILNPQPNSRFHVQQVLSFWETPHATVYITTQVSFCWSFQSIPEFTVWPQRDREPHFFFVHYVCTLSIHDFLII